MIKYSAGFHGKCYLWGIFRPRQNTIPDPSQVIDLSSDEEDCENANTRNKSSEGRNHVRNVRIKEEPIDYPCASRSLLPRTNMQLNGRPRTSTVRQLHQLTLRSAEMIPVPETQTLPLLPEPTVPERESCVRYLAGRTTVGQMIPVPETVIRPLLPEPTVPERDSLMWFLAGRTTVGNRGKMPLHAGPAMCGMEGFPLQRGQTWTVNETERLLPFRAGSALRGNQVLVPLQRGQTSAMREIEALVLQSDPAVPGLIEKFPLQFHPTMPEIEISRSHIRGFCLANEREILQLCGDYHAVRGREMLRRRPSGPTNRERGGRALMLDRNGSIPPTTLRDRERRLPNRGGTIVRERQITALPSSSVSTDLVLFTPPPEGSVAAQPEIRGQQESSHKRARR